MNYKETNISDNYIYIVNTYSSEEGTQIHYLKNEFDVEKLCKKYSHISTGYYTCISIYTNNPNSKLKDIAELYVMSIEKLKGEFPQVENHLEDFQKNTVPDNPDLEKIANYKKAKEIYDKAQENYDKAIDAFEKKVAEYRKMYKEQEKDYNKARKILVDIPDGYIYIADIYCKDENSICYPVNQFALQSICDEYWQLGNVNVYTNNPNINVENPGKLYIMSIEQLHNEFWDLINVLKELKELSLKEVSMSQAIVDWINKASV